jgi:hypothetical protein
MSEQTATHSNRRTFPAHGWMGIVLIGLFWTLNWSLPGVRTHWAFFPLWLGYCLTIDGLVFLRRSTSLLTRSRSKYIGLFLVSAPVWWLFELLNARLGNWHYQGAEFFHPLVYAFWATLSFTTVIPAVFGSAELVSSFAFMQKKRRGPVVRPDRTTTLLFFTSGIVMLAVMLLLPKVFFPFVWISIYFITEPINIWLGNRNLARWTQHGDWRPVIALWLGVLLTAFFWEMWNYLAYPKWVYSVPWGDFWHIFEMPLLGYGGYLPFALELFAIYHLVAGLLGDKNSAYVQLAGQADGD